MEYRDDEDLDYGATREFDVVLLVFRRQEVNSRAGFLGSCEEFFLVSMRYMHTSW